MEKKSRFELPESLKFCTNLYEVTEIIGEGTFSIVYGGKSLSNGLPVAVKAITRTTSPQRMLNELRILSKLNGKPNCIPLLHVHRNNDQVIAVFPRFHATEFVEFLKVCTMKDIKAYMYNLISGVNEMHDANIVHRDLKPSNFMYNMKTREGFLIDFGLAHFDKEYPQPDSKPKQPLLFFNSIVVPSKPPGYYEGDTRNPMKAPRAGTRGFRAPEVLFKYPKQSKAIDMWSVGVIFLSLLTGQYPFFLSADDVDGLVEIATLFGHSEMRKAAKLYGRVWKCNIPTVKEEGTPFELVIRKLNPSLKVHPEALNLLRALLDLNCNSRITAKEALKHALFSEEV